MNMLSFLGETPTTASGLAITSSQVQANRYPAEQAISST
jgi:hypothetical protein